MGKGTLGRVDPINPIAVTDVFGSLVRNNDFKENSQEMTDERVKELAFCFVVEQVRRGLWANPPVEVKLYLCGEGCQTVATTEEIEIFITKISKSA